MSEAAVEYVTVLMLAVPFWFCLFAVFKDPRVRAFLVPFPLISLRLQVILIACGILLLVRIAQPDTEFVAMLRKKVLPFKRPNAKSGEPT